MVYDLLKLLTVSELSALLVWSQKRTLFQWQLGNKVTNLLLESSKYIEYTHHYLTFYDALSIGQ